MNTTTATTVESTHVCDSCHLWIGFEGGDGPAPLAFGPEWFSHGCDCEDCEECDYCETCDWHLESSPSWACPGCGVTGVMFADMWRVSRIVNN